MADEVDERPVGGDGQVRFRRPRRHEHQASGRGGHGAVLVDGDVGGVDGGGEDGGRVDRRVRPGGDAELLEPRPQVDLVGVVPLREQQLERSGRERVVDLIQERLVEAGQQLGVTALVGHDDEHRVLPAGIRDLGADEPISDTAPIGQFELPHEGRRHRGPVERGEGAVDGSVLAERPLPVSLEVDGVGQRQDGLRADRVGWEQFGDEVFGAFPDPRVDLVAAPVGVAGEIERDDVGTVLRREQIDPRLVGSDVETGPDAIGDRQRHLVRLASRQLLVDAVPCCVGPLGQGERGGDRRPCRVIASRLGHQQGVADAGRAEHHVGRGLLRPQQVEPGLVEPGHQRGDGSIDGSRCSRDAARRRERDTSRADGPGDRADGAA